MNLTSNFRCQFNVLAIPKEPKMFMLNMQVFEVHPYMPVVQQSEFSDRVATVWCAVFNMKAIKNS